MRRKGRSCMSVGMADEGVADLGSVHDDLGGRHADRADCERRTADDQQRPPCSEERPTEGSPSHSFSNAGLPKNPSLRDLFCALTHPHALLSPTQLIPLVCDPVRGPFRRIAQLSR